MMDNFLCKILVGKEMIYRLFLGLIESEYCTMCIAIKMILKNMIAGKNPTQRG